MKRWLNKTVGFSRDDPEDMELFRFSQTLPNFTAMVKQWLRSVRDSGPIDTWVVPVEAVKSLGITEQTTEVGVEQFL